MIGCVEAMRRAAKRIFSDLLLIWFSPLHCLVVFKNDFFDFYNVNFCSNATVNTNVVVVFPKKTMKKNVSQFQFRLNMYEVNHHHFFSH